jgi:hypothetical protein
VITENGWGGTGEGSGIVCGGGGPKILCNVISGNFSLLGGGITCGGPGLPELINNLIVGNRSWEPGGGVACNIDSHVSITNCTICGNVSDWVDGGGIFCMDDTSSAMVDSCIVRDNTGEQIHLWDGGDASVDHSDIEGGYDGQGNIDADPIFVTGPRGDYYLSQVDAGHAEDSPCLDAGDGQAADICFDTPDGTVCMDQMTTSGRFTDVWQVDMGYHYTMTGDPRLVAGPGPAYWNAPRVRVFPPEPDAVHEYEFLAYSAPHYGVNVACGDVSGGNGDEILTGAGPGPIYGPHVRGFEADGTPLPGLSFQAYGTRKWGVNVAAGRFQ